MNRNILHFIRYAASCEPVQSNGKILLGGQAQNSPGSSGYGLARFSP